MEGLVYVILFIGAFIYYYCKNNRKNNMILKARNYQFNSVLTIIILNDSIAEWELSIAPKKLLFSHFINY